MFDAGEKEANGTTAPLHQFWIDLDFKVCSHPYRDSDLDFELGFNLDYAPSLDLNLNPKLQPDVDPDLNSYLDSFLCLKK